MGPESGEDPVARRDGEHRPGRCRRARLEEEVVVVVVVATGIGADRGIAGQIVERNDRIATAGQIEERGLFLEMQTELLAIPCQGAR